MKGNQILYHDGFWYLFYFNGSNAVCEDGAILYRVSSGGGNWSEPKIAASNLDTSAYFSVYSFNEIVVVAYSTMPPQDSFHNGVAITRKGTFSSPDITWNDPVMLFGGPEIGRIVGAVWGDYAFGQHWLAVEFLKGGGVYNCEIFSTVDFTNWNLSKYWYTSASGYVFTVTLKYVENNRLMALMGSWGSTEFSYMFFDGSSWSGEATTQGAGLPYGAYKAQCEVVVNGTLYMLYSTWDYITALKLAVYNGSWYFSDFLPETSYWGGDSSAALDTQTGTAYFFYINAYTNEVLTAYTSNFVDWTKDARIGKVSFDSPRYTRTTRISEGKIPVAWSEGGTRPFRIKLQTVKASEGDLRDIGITDVTTSKTVIARGLNMTVSLMMFNYGNTAEEFNLTLYANETQIYSATSLIVESSSSLSLAFAWNTSNFARAYSLTAGITVLEGETDISDNSFTFGTVKVTCLGDINGDYVTDGKDMVLVKNAVPSMPSLPRWNPDADVNNDGIVVIKDYQTVKNHIPSIFP